MKHDVTIDAMRPASPKTGCFYCQQPVGDQHKDDCVLVCKKVKVRAIIEYEIDVPHSWDEHMILFHRNDGSWCADNLIDELNSIAPSEDECICYCTKFELIEDSKESFLSEK